MLIRKRGIKTVQEGIDIFIMLLDFSFGRKKPGKGRDDPDIFFTGRELHTQEESLWLAVLRQSVLDLSRGYGEINTAEKPLAEEWIDPVEFYSTEHFHRICGILSIDPERFIDALVCTGALRECPDGYTPKGRQEQLEQSIDYCLKSLDSFRKHRHDPSSTGFEATGLDRIKASRPKVSFTIERAPGSC